MLNTTDTKLDIVFRTRVRSISQIEAAPAVAAVLEENRDLLRQDKSLIAVAETDIYRLRRGLCLPTAVATCVNQVLSEEVCSPLTVGDIYRYLLPLHGAPTHDPVSGETWPGWWVVTPQGDMYHHAACYWVNEHFPALQSHSVAGFNSVRDFHSFIAEGGAVALSLNNSFVWDWVWRVDSENTLTAQDGSNRYFVVNGEKDARPFEDGRHVVSLLGIEGDQCLIADSFQLPGIPQEATVMWLPIDEVDHYLQYHNGASARAIVVTSSGPNLEKHNLCPVPLAVPNTTAPCRPAPAARAG